MDETTGFGRFQTTHLDPRAQEFRPANSCPSTQIALLTSHIYYPYSHPHHHFSAPHFVAPFYDPSTTLPYQAPPPPQSPAACHGFHVGAPPRATATPTRAVVLSAVPQHATEEGVRRELEVFGEVRAVEMGRLPEGIVAVHFYDLRCAQAAVAEIQKRHMEQQSRLRHQHYCGGGGGGGVVVGPVTGPGYVAGMAVWAQFVMPETVPVAVPDGLNQGTIVVFNLDSGVSGCKLKEIFEAFGPVKELRETPLKRHQRFVEFFDIRDAARAVMDMDGKEINGKRVLIEFSRPGGHRRRFSSFNTNTVNFNSSWNSNININSSSSSYNYPKISFQPPPLNVAKSFRRSSSNASSSSTSTSSQPQNTSKNITPTALTSPTWNNNNNNNHNRRWSNNHGSSPPSTALSSMASLSINDGNQEKVNCINGSSSSSVIRNTNSSKKLIRSNSSSSAMKSHQQQHGKQSRSRSWKGSSSSSRQKSLLDSHFLMNKEAMVVQSSSNSCARDTRTTVMIKNIPNKYSQKLLLNMLDNHCIHCNEQIADGGGDDQLLPMSSYDFVYLPIDFNNKCNVGYGFVNMTSPEAAWRLYQAFHMQHWEVFNSRKICEITYARLQGLEALKEHFKNSKFACETDEYLPVVFSPPRDGRQLTEPVAIGGHVDIFKAQQPPTMHAHDDSDGDGRGGDGHDDDDVDDGHEVLVGGVDAISRSKSTTTSSETETPNHNSQLS